MRRSTGVSPSANITAMPTMTKVYATIQRRAVRWTCGPPRQYTKSTWEDALYAVIDAYVSGAARFGTPLRWLIAPTVGGAPRKKQAPARPRSTQMTRR